MPVARSLLFVCLLCNLSQLRATGQTASLPYQNPSLALEKRVDDLVGVRVQPDMAKALDDWRRKQDDLPGRPEAIRRLVELGLKVKK